MNNLITEGHIEKILNRLISKAKNEKLKSKQVFDILNQVRGVKKLLVIADHRSLSKAKLACNEIKQHIEELKNESQNDK